MIVEAMAVFFVYVARVMVAVAHLCWEQVRIDRALVCDYDGLISMSLKTQH